MRKQNDNWKYILGFCITLILLITIMYIFSSYENKQTSDDILEEETISVTTSRLSSAKMPALNKKLAPAIKRLNNIAVDSTDETNGETGNDADFIWNDELNGSKFRITIKDPEGYHSTTEYEKANKLLKEDNKWETMPAGALYNCEIGYIYVPYMVKDTMPAIVYLAGGDGSEYTLNTTAMLEYLQDYTPEAIMLFTANSGYNNMTTTANYCTVNIETAFEEAGCTVSEVIVSGISMGAYTAFETAVAMSDYEMPVKTVIAMDPGLNWHNVQYMDAERCARIAEKNIKFIIFEQSLTNIETKPLQIMQTAGIDICFVKCAHGDHNTLCNNLFNKGILSYALDEYAELDPDEYSPFVQDEVDDSIMADTPQKTEKEEK